MSSHRSQILAGVVTGLAIGITAPLDTPTLHHLLGVLQPVGTLWVNGLQMTAIPLVLSLAVGSGFVRRAREIRPDLGVSLAHISDAHLAVAASTATVTRPLLS